VATALQGRVRIHEPGHAMRTSCIRIKGVCFKHQAHLFVIGHLRRQKAK
jgi:hypothetical protein